MLELVPALIFLQMFQLISFWSSRQFHLFSILLSGVFNYSKDLKKFYFRLKCSWPGPYAGLFKGIFGANGTEEDFTDLINLIDLLEEGLKCTGGRLISSQC